MNVAVGALDVPAIEDVRTVKVPAIGAERARADSTEEVRPPPAKEEAEEDEDEEGVNTVSGKLVAFAKLAQGLVEVSPLSRFVCEADLFLQALSCNG